MTDKSFGDYTSRSTLKNPLLSTAVTGLSIEDLTHNAVLLPVARSQGLNIRQDQQTGSQSHTLAAPNQPVANYPSGDANTTHPPSHPPPTIKPNILDTKQNENRSKINETPLSTVSKASSKSEDDFDVNEYFARLQGTRYVSAPINSLLKEDKNANLEAVEDNLEEINLNESDRQDVQQSLTADIAQNFSQLPTVLPQVASAVFSSFSNMLSMKSREQTPDDAKISSGYQGVNFNRPEAPDNAKISSGYQDFNRAQEVGVPLMGVDEPVKEVAPPPKEPPVIGISNYRITTRKKAYAQIPGLTSKDNAQSSTAYPPLTYSNVPPTMSQTNFPSYFTPTAASDMQNPTVMAFNDHILQGEHKQKTQSDIKIIDDNRISSENVQETPRSQTVITNIEPNLYETKAPISGVMEEKVEHAFYGHSSQISQPNAAIIPPPPMFSNLPKRDSQSAVGKTVLPPSVARRISSNQPIIKSNTSQTPVFSENIFVPTIEPAIDNQAISAAVLTPPNPLQSGYPQTKEQDNTATISFEPVSQVTLTNVAQFTVPQKLPNVAPPVGPTAGLSSFPPNANQASVIPNIPPPPKTIKPPLTGSVSRTPLVPSNVFKASEPPLSSISIFTPNFSEDNVQQTSTFTSSAPDTQSLGINIHATPGSLQAPSLPSPSKDTLRPVPATNSQWTSGTSVLSPESLATNISTVPYHPSVSISPSLPPPPMNIFTPIVPSDSPASSANVVLSEQSATNISTMPIKPPSIPINLALPPKNIFTPVESDSTLDATRTIEMSTASLPLPPANIFQPQLASSSLLPPVTVLTSQPALSSSNNIQNSLAVEAAVTSDQISQANLVQPPTFFNPTTLQTQTQNMSEEIKEVAQQNVIDQYLNASAQAPKLLAEPPKVTGNLSYRMTKKRPQYYSGPIEGFGSISNNIKPVIPEATPSTFQGALFTPPQQTQETVDQELVAPNIEQATVPFSLPVSSFASFDISNPPETTYTEPSYNTAFDLSRQTTESYEAKQEPRGFGIIGTLKSKLTSLDMNRIQNSVTTFFDPGYNDIKKEDRQTRPEYQSATTSSAYNQQDNLGIFIDQPTQSYQQSYQNYQQPTYNYGQNNQYYNTQEYNYQHQEQYPDTYTDYNQNATPITYSGGISLDVTQPYPATVNIGAINAINILQGSAVNEMIPGNVNMLTAENIRSDLQVTAASNSNEIAQSQSSVSGSSLEPIPAVSKMETNFFPKHFYDSQISTTSETVPETEEMERNIGINFMLSEDETKDDNVNRERHDGDDTGEVLIRYNTEARVNRETENSQTNLEDAFTNFPFGVDNNRNSIYSISNYTQGFEHNSIYTQGTSQNKLNNSYSNFIFDNDNRDRDLFQILQNRDEINMAPLTDNYHDNISSISIFDSTSTSDLSRDIIKIEDTMKSVSLYELSKNVESLFEREASATISENDTENRPLLDDSQEEDNVSDFNICETCREVNQPEDEDKESDDLTSQLIENIIAPIQLLNPVEVPLTESNTPVDDRIDFDTEQCAEISNIAEETIETIQVQSVTKLLDDDDDLPIEQSAVGWSTDNLITTSKVPDHDYTFHLDSNTAGFFGDNSLFFDNIPNNASDEIKAEFKNSQEEPHPVSLPIPLSIPSATPVSDDDSKSDETGGLDVHSIEQDANKDFPLFEEFVIDPSETDDDKIEFRERERSSEDPISDIDTFTSRLERFQKMEEVIGEGNDDVSETQTIVHQIDAVTTTSPAITIASYFDTGNYAVETHYKNSITSPINQISIGSPNISMRIPPGFEDEYQRRMSGVSQDSNKNEPYIPETSTQTRVTSTTTYSSPRITTIDTLPKTDLKEQIHETVADKLPPFVTSFGINKKVEEGQSLEPVHSSIQDVTNIPIFGLSIVKDEEKSVATKTSEPETIQQTLPDPLSFFSSREETPKPEENENSFNRLASYFTTPTKTDPAKSFFELSQSQNHYRHASNQNDNPKVNTDHKSIEFKSSLNTNEMPNIPYDINLIKDLTSSQNLKINKDQIVRTVNYFTIEHDNSLNIKEIKLSEPAYKENNNYANNADIGDKNELEETNDGSLIIKKCTYCCNAIEVVFNKEFKVRKAMDSDSSEARKESVGGAEERKDRDGSIKREVTVNLDNVNEDGGLAVHIENRSSTEYVPVKHHWFYRVDNENKSIWKGFSLADSQALEEAYNSPNLNENTLVATDGGRYDVNIVGRLRVAVYWTDKPTNVRRCSWFYKGNIDARFVPYSEAVAEKLEEEYRHGITTNEWHRRLILPNNELVVMHGPAVMVHLLQGPGTDAFGSTPLFFFGKRVYRNTPKIKMSADLPIKIDHLVLLVHGAGEYKHQRKKIQSAMRPRVVRRGWDEAEIEDSEPSSIDHLLLLCHGVGSACDMRFRPVEEVVDDFRATSFQLLQSHYRNSYDNGVVNRVEILPISWHSTLHSGETGVDRRLAQITLDSIPRLRSFTNDTVLDVLFYTSPVFCQTIIDTVCAELNRIYSLFKSRNPEFTGGITLGGHSLGSVILFDLLCHQPPPDPTVDKRYMSGVAGTGQSAVRYPLLKFSPTSLYALGSPIAMFECIRGVESLGGDFALPTCRNFFNIFHPYDPIAYRIEPLINPLLRDVKPSQIPHHKGRKRMHLELKDTMARVGADLKQKLLESLKSTWSNMWKTQPPPHDGQLAKVVEEEIEKEHLCEDSKEETQNLVIATPEMLGSLNAGRRVDFVLQEAPFEMINEYLFAMSSHVCYWESEDTMLMMLREIYDGMGVQPDCSVPQQSMTVQRDETILLNHTEPSTSRGST